MEALTFGWEVAEAVGLDEERARGVVLDAADIAETPRQFWQALESSLKEIEKREDE